MELIFATTVIAATLPIIYILYTWIYNHYSNQYFQKNLPKLPILDGQQPILGHIHLILGSRNWKHQQHGHKKHGKTYGCYLANHRFISTIDLDFIKKYAINDDLHDRFPEEFSVGLEVLETDNVGSAKGEQWRRIRKAIAPGFSKHKVMSLNVQEEIKSVINKFIASIEWRFEQARKEKYEDFIVEDMEEYCHRYSLALTFKCLYKKDNLIDFYARKDYWLSKVELSSKLGCTKLALLPPVFPIIKQILKIFPLVKIIFRPLLCFVSQQADLYKRASLESKKISEPLDEARFTLNDGTTFKGNMVDHFIGKFLDKSITEREFYHTSAFLFLAADKTASDAITRLVYLLACHQRVQEKLRNSIQSDGVESVYLTWVINETLRLFPPVQMCCMRTPSHPIETEFGKIPKDTIISAHAWTIHRWPEYWGEDADYFKPQRWANSDKFHPMQFIPFGTGRRMCPGKEFALREIRMLIVELLQRYKFEMSNKTTYAFEFDTPYQVMTVSDFPIWVKISRLEDPRGL